MRIGIILFAHESNTFLSRETQLADFEADVLFEGEDIPRRFAEAHHEVGGFLNQLRIEGARPVPIFAARALPAGVIQARTYETLLSRLQQCLSAAGPLDGLLLAPHGAMVTETQEDADGHWLHAVRQQVGSKMPIIATLDPHANLSRRMVDSCQALIAYRTNPHLDQHTRGREAAEMLVRTIRGEFAPTMSAHWLPLAMNIECQCTNESPLTEIYGTADTQLRASDVLSNSILLGFPYADVADMGSAVLTVTNDNLGAAQRYSEDLASQLWENRQQLKGNLIDVESAVDRSLSFSGKTCLLDMGDNVGGGSAGDGTYLVNALLRRRIPRSFACLCDAEVVQRAREAGQGGRIQSLVGGKTDDLHGPAVEVSARVAHLSDGRFREVEVRHGGMSSFDQGLTAVLETDDGLTLMLTSKRMVPFSLQQLRSNGVDPHRLDLFVAKGVHAPVAAYREVCSNFIRVNTRGSTTADLRALHFRRRRRPMYPFEGDVQWP